MTKTCYEIQDEILQQKMATEVFNKQIDIHQEKTTTKVKDLIIHRHFLSQRVLMTELYIYSKNIKNPLELSCFKTTESNVEANFASLDLPDDISKNPIKAFLNNLFDNIDSFLTPLYKFDLSNFSTLSQSTLQGNSGQILLTCVFPALFGYCWNEQSSISYGSILAAWMTNCYKEQQNFLTSFRTNWISHAIRGFFISIDVHPFINAALQPIFFDYVQLQLSEQKDPQTLVNYSIRIIDSMHDHFDLLPKCINSFFSEIFKTITDEKDQNTLLHYTFFDLLLAPCFRDPILSSVSDVILPPTDYINFEVIYTVFEIKFASNQEHSGTFYEEITQVESFSQLNPFVIKDDILNMQAQYSLPDLQEFCEIVQCAHQPLLMSTHYLAVLFRLAESLQEMKALPKSLERPLNTIIQDSYAMRLEQIPDHLFWFPCYSLNYVNVQPIQFIKETKTSSLYRILSSDNLRISPLDTDFRQALLNSADASTFTTQPELLTEVQWLLNNNQDNSSFLYIDSEIQLKQNEINIKRERALKLCLFAQIVQERSEHIPKGARRALVTALLPKFKQFSKADVQSSSFMSNINETIKTFCGEAYSAIGQQLAEAVLVVANPCIKYQPRDNSDVSGIHNPDIEIIRQNLVQRPIVSSSCYPMAKKLIPSLQALKEYEKLIGQENLIQKVFASALFEYSKLLSSSISDLLLPLPIELLTMVFSKEDLILLQDFSNMFQKKK